MAKLVVIIQCDIVQKKCVGYACMKSFYERSGRFTGYDADTKYMTITCGGCCGAGVAGKIEDLNRKLKRWGDDRRDVVVHLASCVVSDNYHRPPCPHRDYIKTIRLPCYFWFVYFQNCREKTSGRHLRSFLMLAATVVLL